MLHHSSEEDGSGCAGLVSLDIRHVGPPWELLVRRTGVCACSQDRFAMPRLSGRPEGPSNKQVQPTLVNTAR
jgi:hypothetical protein